MIDPHVPNFEREMSGHPWAIVRVDMRRFKVDVVAHATTHTQAQATVDQLTQSPETQEHVIVASSRLQGYLAAEREAMAVRMRQAFLI